MPRKSGWLALLPALAALVPAHVAFAAPVSFQSDMQAASQARGVPLAVVEATAYVNTRWEWINTPEIDGGVGPMKVLPSQLALASSLSGHTQAEIKGDLASNLDAGAALMANAHTSGTTLASWRAAVAQTQGPLVADEIFTVLQSGATRTTSTGEVITLAPQSVQATGGGASSTDAAAGSTTATATASPDYPTASWVPANSSNFTVSNRTASYPINFIIIHDIEGSAGSAIQAFQDPNRAASAHYVVDYNGAITQMVLEKDIAWHAGNWDYNTRSIGIEHAGFASQNLYTGPEYNASAYLSATICSKYGVPMDRNHVIGHYQVPDPFNPGLYGGDSHHWDPGPYWDWTYYMGLAQHYAATLPSPPRMGPNPRAVNGLTSATVTWQPAQTCRAADVPITGYQVTIQPGGQVQNLSAGATSATFNNLTQGTSYRFTVTATNADGQSSLTSNAVVPGRCNNVRLSASPASPQTSGATVQLSATSASCANPRYAFGVLAPGSSTWSLLQGYSSTSTYTWRTAGLIAGSYQFVALARDANSPGNSPSTLGTYDDSDDIWYTLKPVVCSSVTASTSPGTSSVVGTPVTITATASGCPSPLYQFWVLPPGSSTWQVAQPYSSSATLNWSTSGRSTGLYRFSVWVHDSSGPGANSSSLGSYDTYAATSYTLTPPVCSSAAISATPPSPATVGTQVTLTATSSGCPNPVYAFWMRAQGSSTWQLVRGYSASATYTWNSTGAAPGTELFGLWVRDASSSAAYDSTTSISYSVKGPSCASVTMSASPPSPIAHGTGAQVTLTAVAAGCSSPNPLYEFWMLPAGSSTWVIVRGYATSASYVWNTNGAPAGTEQFGVWVKDARSSAPYDAFTSISYTLS